MFLITENNKFEESGVDAYIIHTGNETLSRAIDLSLDLRKNGISVDLDPETKGFKAQFKKAERERASFFIIIGDDELAEGKVSIKNQKTGEQMKVAFDEVVSFFNRRKAEII